ncbi:MAG TPA: VOC family protein [bacterium]|jgi:predicted enzyme related to lactoylglutathione lyase
MYTFAHVELPVRDLRQASAFYGALFQWKFQPFYGDDYLMICAPDGQEIGGLTRVDEVPYINGFWNYVEVADIEKTLDLVQRLGGKIVRPKGELPDHYGSYAVLQSPDGYNLGIWCKAAA